METPLRVLVAEDELGDVLLLKRAFAVAGVGAPVYFARDGQEVVDYLEGKPPFENPVQFPLPNLLLLDLKLPRINGFDVLAWIRAQPSVRRLLVVVLSSSDAPEDIDRAYALGANSYLIKPCEPAALVQMVKRLQDYWLNINAVPEHTVVPAL